MRTIKKRCIQELRRRFSDKGHILEAGDRDLMLALKHINETQKTEAELKLLKLKETQLKMAIQALSQQIEDSLENVTLTGPDALEWRLKSTLEDLQRIDKNAECRKKDA